jgi:vacuolar protein sorting-associated protein VTA1
MACPQARVLLPFLQRADEISKANPKVAYFCRLHAIEEGMRLSDRTKETNKLLASILRQLEVDKPKVSIPKIY